MEQFLIIVEPKDIYPRKRATNKPQNIYS